jgi:hypothetical protein
MITLMILYVSSGAVLVLLALPLWLGKVPPNPFYGFRIAPALDDPDLWYPTNRYSAGWLIASGATAIATALLLALVPGISIDVYALGCLAVFAAVFHTGLVLSVRRMKALARQNHPT